ncbi:MAG: 5-dehydro-2-deoxygluconokinase [Chloroflexota bacterium]
MDTFDILSVGRLAGDLYATQVGVPLSAVKQFNLYVGGCPANVAVGARRLGLRTAMLSRVGNDGIAENLLSFMRQEGINTESVTCDPNHLTGLAFLSILPPETFPLVYYRPDPADLQLSLEDVRRAPIAESRVLFVAGTNFNADPSRTSVLWGMEQARAANRKVVLDIDLRKSLWPELEAFGVNLRTAARLSDIVIGTEEEIVTAAGIPDVKHATDLLLALGVEAVAVKRGSAGAEVYTADGAIHTAKPFQVEVLNVLGAGDAWASGFLYAYLNGWDWERCVRFGNATGAIIVTRHACANDMPTLAEVQAFMSSQGAN